MKANLKNLFLILAVVPFFFASCEGNDPVDAIKLSANKVSLKINQSETVGVLEGNGGYTVVTSASSVATAEVGKDKESIIITAIGVGTATITVSGKDADAATIAVTVTDGDYETFTVTLGGSDATTAGSFLSVKDKKAYKTSEITSKTNNVEIIFDGTAFKSAKDSKNVNISENGHSATIKSEGDNVFSYTTSTGYEGSLTVTGDMNSASAVVEVSVKRAAVE